MPNFFAEQKINEGIDRYLWKIGCDSRIEGWIKHNLRKGIFPQELNVKIRVYDKRDGVSKDKYPMSILLENNLCSYETVSFDRADELHKLGARLPKVFKDRKSFTATSVYFAHLIEQPHDLYIALRSHPNIIREQDENGKTLLHHALTPAIFSNAQKATLVHYLLLNAPGADLQCQDSDGNTPLHIAVVCNTDEFLYLMSPFYLQTVLDHLKEHPIKFDDKNMNNQTVLNLIDTQVSAWEKLLASKNKHTREQLQSPYLEKRAQELIEIKNQLLTISNDFQIRGGAVSDATHTASNRCRP